jgi:hypothetical protein
VTATEKALPVEGDTTSSVLAAPPPERVPYALNAAIAARIFVTRSELTDAVRKALRPHKTREIPRGA